MPRLKPKSNNNIESPLTITPQQLQNSFRKFFGHIISWVSAHLISLAATISNLWFHRPSPSPEVRDFFSSLVVKPIDLRSMEGDNNAVTLSTGKIVTAASGSEVLGTSNPQSVSLDSLNERLTPFEKLVEEKKYISTLENRDLHEVVKIIDNLDLSIEERDEILAYYIEIKRIPLCQLNLTEEAMLRLSKHLSFIDLRGFRNSDLGQEIIKHCAKSYELLVDNTSSSIIKAFSRLSRCTSLDCSGCPALTALPELPNCTTLSCSRCTALTALPELPSCTRLYCTFCAALTALPELPNCTTLDCSYCRALTALRELPNCTSLKCYDCRALTTLPELPSCWFLDCSNCNALTDLPELPSCKILNCSNCTALTALPELPKCTRLNCSNCRALTALLGLPECTSLDCSHCVALTDLPELPNCKRLDIFGVTHFTGLPELPNCPDSNIGRDRSTILPERRIDGQSYVLK